MVDSLPTASVTGKEDWEWNRSQAGRQSRIPPPRSTAPEHHPVERPAPHRRGPPASDATAAAREREHRRLQTVIDRYECLLEDRNRRLAEATAAHPSPSPVTAAVQYLRRLLAGR